jgi:hypothetical protein
MFSKNRDWQAILNKKKSLINSFNRIFRYVDKIK